MQSTSWVNDNLNISICTAQLTERLPYLDLVREQKEEQDQAHREQEEGEISQTRPHRRLLSGGILKNGRNDSALL